MKQSLLYPCTNACRNFISLDGLWKMQFDPEGTGSEQNWQNGLPEPFSMPVPASFADIFTEKEKRDYCGDFWYETKFYLDDDDSRNVILRFGSITHRADVYVNSIKAGYHEGGFTPFVLDITGLVHFGNKNRISVRVNNELNETSIPCGSVKTHIDGHKTAAPYFDFFNYSGIQRSVHLLRVPKESIIDYDTVTKLEGNDAVISYHVTTDGDHEVIAELFDCEHQKVASSKGKDGELSVKDAHLWKVRDAYLYSLVLQIVDEEGNTIDKYPAKLGIRTIETKGKEILLNGKPVYLKGYGKHEDFEVIGRQFNYAVAARDFECMKWTNANCFRTSHYPYAEEWYQMADEEGFLIIDEVPAVGMMRSLMNFAAAGAGGKDTRFFMADTVKELQNNHRNAIEEMIIRDKNHPSVIAFSLFNEPETTYPEAHDYFRPLFDFARQIDPEKRPLTGALLVNSTPDKDTCASLCDIIALNRYYGWYIAGGPDLPEAEAAFRKEMDEWAKVCDNKPLIFTEFGADTYASEHKLPSVMWAQEYQNEYYEMNFRVMSCYDFVQGELVWNFADFQTTEGIMRVNGNKKGIFTRNRQPKDAAYLLKKRWSEK
ncbi:MAG: beta-glucuronidase [Erysipelotrichaceae bacterium]|nr:beta-glucuronidase [Erysipelotrichaceae bacterium]